LVASALTVPPLCILGETKAVRIAGHEGKGSVAPVHTVTAQGQWT
jgi:hypothetical protein